MKLKQKDVTELEQPTLEEVEAKPGVQAMKKRALVERDDKVMVEMGKEDRYI